VEIRERIITEAFGLFGKSGIRSVTMDQIANYLGISKRTLYENFKDKNELLAEGIEHFRKIMHAEAANLLKNSSNVIEGIYFIGRHGEKMRKSVNPLFFEDIRKYYPEIHAGLSEKTRYSEYSIMRSLIRKGMNDGVFNKSLNPDIVNEFWHEIMNIFMNEETFPRDRYTQEDLIKNMIMPYLIGISTEKGKGLIEKYFKKETYFNGKS
jgi:TetR/AcrR family transcriptional regulator, cholesterol catabolism regulator